jgi:polyphenol oxidase
VEKQPERRLKYDFQYEENNGIILPQIFRNNPELSAGMSTILDGECKSAYGMNLSYNVGDDPSNVKRNRDLFYSRLHISGEQLAIPLQCHSDTVLKIDTPGEYGQCDALITNVKRIALVVTVADCVPILLFDPVNKAIGAVHAGWRGTAGQIVKRTVVKMTSEYQTDPSRLLAFIGPSAGVCCYEVGEEVAVMFKNKIVSYSGNSVFVDLKEENKLHLQQEGTLVDHIEVSKFCTICEKELFHSFRRDGKKSGRMMATICMIL